MVDISYVRNVSVKLVLEHLKAVEVDVDAVLSRAGLQVFDLRKEDGWVPFYNHARFFDAAGQALNDPYFALKLAREIDPREFGSLAYLGISSKTLGDSLLNLKRYMGAVTGAWNMDVLVQGEFVALEIKPDHSDYFDYQMATEWFVANLIHGYQFFIGKNYAPHEVRFVGSLGDNKTLIEYEKMFGCKVSFGQNRCQVIIDREAMKFPIKSADHRLLKVLKLHCDQLLQEPESAQSAFIAKIREKIIDQLPSGRAKVKLIATELGLTERTMLRRLADEETSFSEIRETLRSDMATKYIRDGRLSLKQIAYLLGYGDQSAFSVAFRRWNGCTPKEFRGSEEFQVDFRV